MERIAARWGRAVVPALVILAVIQLGTAAWMVLASHGFFHRIGPFGLYNGHYLRDAAAFTGGLGVALALAVRHAGMRFGALAAFTASTGLHAVNHWADIGHAHAGTSAGPGDAISLTILAAFGVVLTLAARPARPPG